MTALLARLLDVVVLAFSVGSMLALGMGHSLREVADPLRKVGRVLRILAVNFVLVPLLAIVILRLIPLDQPVAIGLLLTAMAAGAPFLIQLTAHAEHDIGLSATLLLLLLPATIVYMPIVVPFVLPDVRVSAWAIATPLLVTMLLPLAIGFAVRAVAPRVAARLGPMVGRIASIALVLLVLLTVALHWRSILALFGTGAILAAALLIGGAFAIGYALGGRDQETRGILGLATGQRNIAAATVVATQTFEDPGELVMVIVTSLVALAMLFPIASLLRRRLEAPE